MEDEDDLEFLRLAALKSLNAKKENVPTSISTSAKPIANQSFKAVSANNSDVRTIPVVNNVTGLRPVDEYYPTVLPVPRHPVDTYIGSQFEKIDIKDQYIPQRVNVPPTINGHFGSIVPEYVPFVSAPIASVGNIPNVQLSPRSAAFVLHNNDILMRRKTGVSPGSPRSRSPSPYRSGLGRWSVTPPPMAKKPLSRSPKRSPYVYRRSASRSPIRRASRSPIGRRSPNRNRSLSRSPQRHNRRSPPVVIHRPKRSKSRSPPPRSTYNRPPRSRSPAHQTRHGNSPTNYHQGRQWNQGSNGRKSLSPRNNENTSNSNYRLSPKRRTRSPINNKIDSRRRSTSHSPARKYHRNAPPNRRRRSPPRKYNNRPRNPRAGYNNRSSPANRRRSGSATSPLEKNKLDGNPPSNKVDNQKKNETTEMKENTEKIEKETAKAVEPKTDSKEQHKPAKKSEQQLEDELLASTDDEKNSDSDDNKDDDGIDLFASEESESENEGRFKSSSSKTERTASTATVSFSKLGTSEVTPAVALRDLDELRSDKNSSNRKDGSRDRPGRNSKYSGRRNDRYGRKPRSSSRDRDSNRNSTRSSTWKSVKDDSRKKDAEVDVKAESDRKPTMFKSTFQVVDNEPKKIIVEKGKKINIKMFFI